MKLTKKQQGPVYAISDQCLYLAITNFYTCIFRSIGGIYDNGIVIRKSLIISLEICILHTISQVILCE